MITKPFDFVSRLTPPSRDLDFVAWVNVGVIGLFFSLLGSRFILAPGIELQVGGVKSALDLPSAVGTTTRIGAASVVLSYRRDNVILFEGGRYSLADLKKQLDLYVQKHPGAQMLVRADKQVTVQALAELGDMAAAVGFSNVIIALTAEPAVSASGMRD